MKKAKAILIALFFIANLFANCDLRFGDGKIVEVFQNTIVASWSDATGDSVEKLVCGKWTRLCKFNNDNHCRIYVTAFPGPYC